MEQEGVEQNNEGQDQGIDPYLAMSPSYMNIKNQSEIVKLLKVPDFLTEFEYKLRGYSIDYESNELKRKFKSVINPKTKKVTKIYNEAMINDAGVDHMMTIVHSHCNNILTMSSFDKETINLMFYDANTSIVQFLFFYSEDYHIKMENFDIVMNECRALIRSCLHRALSGGANDSDKKFLMTTERRVEMHNQISGGGGMGGGGRRGYGGGGYGGGGGGGGLMGFLRGEQ